MFDIYAEVTDRIIAQLEQGIIPWRRPWTGVRTGAISHSTGRPYSILNQLLLGKPGEYMTFAQAKAEGGHIRKGAKAKMVVFWKLLGVQDQDANGDTITKPVPFLRYFQVFHLDDCEGISPKWADKLPDVVNPSAHAEELLNGYIDREHITLEQVASNEAYYSPSRDLIHLPLMEQFDDQAEYYSTPFHEAAHSTGHTSRLNRIGITSQAAAFGSETYSKEELVAEISAASLVHECGLETPQSFKNSAAYVQSWLKALRDDKRMIISAAGQAEKAVRRILNETTEDPAAQ